MAEELLDQVRDLVDGQIDFEGQKLAELLTTVILSAAGLVAFAVGFFLQDIALALKIGLAGTALSFLIIVPPWPFFNRHPVKWLPIGGGTAVAASQQNIVIDEKMFVQH
ncbi:microsomal signal peptidase 12kDa subunit [Microdochium trichocladiopsis]|uniref:Signal peptidase complex subunit 1 n=1 Tax=Microdochium trichocladiopsis TaxID=1682393 RepID=A0A9P8YHF7_9PEZI|nr:microsomal signal peptidase 12kDa subunit [Microdochium trichocladiopsis]KAH7038019.1 microsomal signal peptidase 12kDa subunit [Microdochium trichocladiopsis]